MKHYCVATQYVNNEVRMETLFKTSEANDTKRIHDIPKKQMALKLDNENPNPTSNFAI
jgi:hypothetical protein